MIEDYLRQIDDLLNATPQVIEVVVLRRRIWDTDWEKVLNYRYRIILADGGLIEMTERVLVSRNRLEATKYRHHWQDADGNLIRRWDNAPHHKDIATFPHHLHDGAEENVVNHPETNGLEVLKLIFNEIENSG
jgi:hypothetical protein